MTGALHSTSWHRHIWNSWFLNCRLLLWLILAPACPAMQNFENLALAGGTCSSIWFGSLLIVSPSSSKHQVIQATSSEHTVRYLIDNLSWKNRGHAYAWTALSHFAIHLTCHETITQTCNPAFDRNTRFPIYENEPLSEPSSEPSPMGKINIVWQRGTSGCAYSKWNLHNCHFEVWRVWPMLNLTYGGEKRNRKQEATLSWEPRWLYSNENLNICTGENIKCET